MVTLKLSINMNYLLIGLRLSRLRIPHLFSDPLPEDLPLLLLLLVLVSPLLLGLLDGLLTEPLLLNLVLLADVIVVILAASDSGNAVCNRNNKVLTWRAQRLGKGSAKGIVPKSIQRWFVERLSRAFDVWTNCRIFWSTNKFRKKVNEILSCTPVF